MGDMAEYYADQEQFLAFTHDHTEPLIINPHGKVQPMPTETPSTPRHRKARNKIADKLVKALPTTLKGKVALVDHDPDSRGPLGGVSNRIFAFVEVDGKQVPVVIQVYADERIDGVAEEFMRDYEADQANQARIADFLASRDG